LLYADGRGGLPRDEATAVAWYRKAAERGLALAKVMLGLSYATGRGVPRDDRQAYGWFEQAANDGLPLAQYGLGMLYSNGRGVEPDWIKAHMWLSLAVAGGHVGAAQPLDYAASRLTEADLSRARQLAGQWRPTGSRDVKQN